MYYQPPGILLIGGFLRVLAGGNTYMGFPCSSAGEESACNAGDPSLIPGLGRSAGEGLG